MEKLSDTAVKSKRNENGDETLLKITKRALKMDGYPQKRRVLINETTNWNWFQRLFGWGCAFDEKLSDSFAKSKRNENTETLNADWLFARSLFVRLQDILAGKAKDSFKLRIQRDLVNLAPAVWSTGQPINKIDCSQRSRCYQIASYYLLSCAKHEAFVFIIYRTLGGANIFTMFTISVLQAREYTCIMTL